MSHRHGVRRIVTDGSRLRKNFRRQKLRRNTGLGVGSQLHQGKPARSPRPRSHNNIQMRKPSKTKVGPRIGRNNSITPAKSDETMKNQAKKPLGNGNQEYRTSAQQVGGGAGKHHCNCPARSFPGLSGTSVTPPCHQDRRSGLSESLIGALNWSGPRNRELQRKPTKTPTIRCPSS